MNKCNAELMKELKRIQEELSEKKSKVVNESVVRYYENEEEPDKSFDYEALTDEIKELYKQEQNIKRLLAYSNATTKLINYSDDITIGEGLVKLVELNSYLSTILVLKKNNQIIKRVEHAKFEGDKDRVIVTEYLYDLKKVDVEIKEVKEKIHQLQVAIDRTNLCNLIEC